MSEKTGLELTREVVRRVLAEETKATVNQSLTVDDVLPEPEHWLIESRGEKTYMPASRFTASSFDTASYTKLYTEQQVRAMLCNAKK